MRLGGEQSWSNPTDHAKIATLLEFVKSLLPPLMPKILAISQSNCSNKLKTVSTEVKNIVEMYG